MGKLRFFSEKKDDDCISWPDQRKTSAGAVVLSLYDHKFYFSFPLFLFFIFLFFCFPAASLGEDVFPCCIYINFYCDPLFICCNKLCAYLCIIPCRMRRKLCDGTCWLQLGKSNLKLPLYFMSFIIWATHGYWFYLLWCPSIPFG